MTSPRYATTSLRNLQVPVTTYEPERRTRECKLCGTPELHWVRAADPNDHRPFRDEPRWHLAYKDGRLHKCGDDRLNPNVQYKASATTHWVGHADSDRRYTAALLYGPFFESVLLPECKRNHRTFEAAENCAVRWARAHGANPTRLTVEAGVR